LYRTRYAGFTAKHFHEHLVKDHCSLGYTWTKKFLHSKGLLEKASVAGRIGASGSAAVARHDAASGRLDACVACGPVGADLVVTMDDATSAILSAFLAPEEGTASTFRGWRRYLASMVCR